MDADGTGWARQASMRSVRDHEAHLARGASSVPGVWPGGNTVDGLPWEQPPGGGAAAEWNKFSGL